MKSTEINIPGFYWWKCPEAACPPNKIGMPLCIIQIGVSGFGMNSTEKCAEAFFFGDPHTYITKNLPGEFYGPINLDDSGTNE
jgi:hypothetical protein